MRILVFGGTRFVGKLLVERLLQDGHTITVVSRRSIGFHKRLASICMERDNSYSLIKDKNFDYVIDFMAYDKMAVKRAFEVIGESPYLLISSSWISQFETMEAQDIQTRKFYDYEKDYVLRKLEAEQAVSNRNTAGQTASVIRFPIILGDGDHSKRLSFYIERVKSLDKILLLNGGQNSTKICFKLDVVEALACVINQSLKLPFMMEGLPPDSLTVQELVYSICLGLNQNPKLINVCDGDITEKFPEFLEEEPLWREKEYRKGGHNLFDVCSIEPTDYKDWLVDCTQRISVSRMENTSLHSKNLAWLNPQFREMEKKICDEFS